jgi:hypothetical protein
MALNLLEKVAPQNMDGGQSGQQKVDSRKRTWSSSNPGGGFSGAATHRGGNNSTGSTSSGGRQTARSQQWKEGGRRDSFRSTHSGSSDGGGNYDRRYSDGRSAREYGGGGGGYNHGYRGKYCTMAATAAEAAEEGATAADSNPVPVPDNESLCAITSLFFSSVAFHLSFFAYSIPLSLCSRKHGRTASLDELINPLLNGEQEA